MARLTKDNFNYILASDIITGAEQVDKAVDYIV